jgi:hypothetical protein
MKGFGLTTTGTGRTMLMCGSFAYSSGLGPAFV